MCFTLQSPQHPHPSHGLLFLSLYFVLWPLPCNMIVWAAIWFLKKGNGCEQNVDVVFCLNYSPNFLMNSF